jgi:hypothetical protein
MVPSTRRYTIMALKKLAFILNLTFSLVKQPLFKLLRQLIIHAHWLIYPLRAPTPIHATNDALWDACRPSCMWTCNEGGQASSIRIVGTCYCILCGWSHSTWATQDSFLLIGASKVVSFTTVGHSKRIRCSKTLERWKNLRAHNSAVRRIIFEGLGHNRAVLQSSVEHHFSNGHARDR